MSSKRARTHSDTPTDLSQDSSEATVTAQASSKVPRRSSPKSPLKSSSNGRIPYRNTPLTCTLPPACSPPNRPPVFANSSELEQHYATYHTHVCTAPLTGSGTNAPIATTGGALGQRRARPRECGKVFPDAWLLDLHLSESHDPLIAIRQERGEKTFTCFVPTCQGKYSTPKARRLHLIDAHKYPKEYFFAVTNKGIGDLLSKWGQGASMVRGEWKPRLTQDQDTEEGEQKASEESEEGEGSVPDRGVADQSAEMKVDEPDSLPSGMATMSITEVEKSASKGPNKGGRQQQTRHRDVPPHMDLHPSASRPSKPANRSPPPASSIDGLAASMSGLSLVPPSIKFGRGGMHGGFVGSGRTPKNSRGLVKDLPSPTRDSAQSPNIPTGEAGASVANTNSSNQPRTAQVIKAM